MAFSQITVWDASIALVGVLPRTSVTSYWSVETNMRSSEDIARRGENGARRLQKFLTAYLSQRDFCDKFFPPQILGLTYFLGQENVRLQAKEQQIVKLLFIYDGAIMARWRAETERDVTNFDGCGFFKYCDISLHLALLMFLKPSHNLLVRGSTLRGHQLSSECFWVYAS